LIYDLNNFLKKELGSFGALISGQDNENVMIVPPKLEWHKVNGNEVGHFPLSIEL